MPRPKKQQPAYHYHVSGQARVRLAGRDFYLGKHGTPESYARYYALLGEYNANGKQAPSDDAVESIRMVDDAILVKQVVADFRYEELPRYESNASHHSRYSNLLDLLDAKHGDEPVDEFGPVKLKALRKIFIDQGIGKKCRPQCRRQANDNTRDIVRIIEHGVSRELVKPESIVALKSLRPLKKGEARDNPKREGVDPETVKKTIPFLSKTVADMIRLQMATAMRPSELFRMTPVDIDRSGKVWFYRPAEHKTQHHGKSKAVPIPTDMVEVLSPYLFGDSDKLCFMTSKKTSWNKDSYRRAVTRAAKAAKAKHWTPYLVRHTSLQASRDHAGPECTQALAGHSKISTQEIYARVNEAKAVQAASVTPRV